jgi:hypothetical protein
VVAGVALASLLCLEWLLAITLFGREPLAVLQHYGTVPGAIGLAGQVAFAIIPLVRRTGRRDPDDVGLNRSAGGNAV